MPRGLPANNVTRVSDTPSSTDPLPPLHSVEAPPDVDEPHEPSSAGRTKSQFIGLFVVPIALEIYADGLFELTGPMGSTPASHRINCPKNRKEHLKKIAQRPMWISATGRTADTGEELLKLTALPADPTDPPIHHWVSRKQIASRNELIKLASLGFAIRAGNADRIEAYLDRAYHLNANKVERIVVASRSGAYEMGESPWPDGAKGWGWLLGDVWVGPPGTAAAADPRKTHKLSRGHGVKGDPEVWLKFWNHVAGQSRVCRWLLYATFAAPLLQFLNQRSFIIHQYGDSGHGKSALLKLAQSAFGDPTQIVGTWNRTEISITEAFRYVSNLPFALDEMQVVKSKKIIQKVIYAICLEEDRERASSEGSGLQDSGDGWSTIGRFTGEEPCVGAGRTVDLGGEGKRVLQLGYEALTEESASAVQRWLLQNKTYGHGGKQFLEALRSIVSTDGAVAKLQQIHKDFTGKIEKSTSCGFARASSLATVAVGQSIAMTVLNKTDPLKAREVALSDAVEIARLIAIDDPESRTLREEAMQIFRDHRAANRRLWLDLSVPADAHALRNGENKQLFGVVSPEDNEVWLICTEANQLLDKHGMPPGRVWRDLKKSGALKPIGTDFTPYRRRDKFRARVRVIEGRVFNEGDA